MKVKCFINIPGNGDLDIGEIYTVYGMSIWEDSLNYLLADDDRPNWYLAKRFEVVDSLIPLNWYFIFKNSAQQASIKPLKALWGYKEMIFDSQHYIDLIEREPEALGFFARRKKEIDEFEKMNEI